MKHRFSKALKTRVDSTQPRSKEYVRGTKFTLRESTRKSISGTRQLSPPLVARRFEPEEEDPRTRPTGLNTVAINALVVPLLELGFGKLGKAS